MIKFLVNDKSPLHEINAVDRGILELKSAVDNLHAQVEGLQHKIDEWVAASPHSYHESHNSNNPPGVQRQHLTPFVKSESQSP